MALENLVWLAAGTGLGLFLAMVLLALGILRDSVAYRRRLRAGRLASAALAPAMSQSPVAEPPPVNRSAARAVSPDPQPVAAAPEPAPVVVAAEPRPVVPPPPQPQPAPPVAKDPVAAAASSHRNEPVAEHKETKPEAEAPAAPIKDEPATMPAEAKPVGIQAAVAAALEKRRAERAARLTAGGEPAPPSIASPPMVRPGPAGDEAAPDVDVEELFAKAFEASADTPTAKPD